MLRLKTPVFLRLPAHENDIDDKVYSNPQKRLSNCPRKDKKRTGARCRKSATAPLVLYGLFLVGQDKLPFGKLAVRHGLQLVHRCGGKLAHILVHVGHGGKDIFKRCFPGCPRRRSQQMFSSSMVKRVFMLSNLQILFMLFLFIFRLLRRLFLVFVQLLQNGRFFLRLFPFLGFYRFCKVGNGNRFPRLCPLLKICNGGVCGVLLISPSKLLSFCSMVSSTCFKGLSRCGCSAAMA